MLYQISHDYLVSAVEAELRRRGYKAGMGRILVDLHLDERFYAMPISVNLAAQRGLYSDERIALPQFDKDKFIETLAGAVLFEDVTNFGGVLRVFARTLLNRAGVSDMFRGTAHNDDSIRQHIIPRVSRILDAMATGWQRGNLTNYDSLMNLIYAEAESFLNVDGSQGLMREDLVSIQALRDEGISSLQGRVGDLSDRCPLQGWVKWIRGLYTGIRCLDSISSFEIDRFNEFVREAINRNDALGLGLLFERRVQEMGLPLAMSFFGDLGYEEFAKPDRHVINALEAYEGERMNPTRAFEALRRYSNEANIRPRRLDKVFYLAGSGNFYLTEFNFGPQFKQGFLEHLRR
jgi:hypothetical protein